jgi:UDP-N-acetylmuramate--alanine ligase
VPGSHNALNALAALAVVDCLGLPVDQAATALGEFSGVGRRFEVLGEAAGITVIDDYAHHPTKIRATLAAARTRYPGRRILVVWQPHTFSRTRALEHQFIESLPSADLVLVTEVYAAREKDESYSARQLVEKMDRQRTFFTPTLADATRLLMQKLQPGDVLVVLSAGDADQICYSVIKQLNERMG